MKVATVADVTKAEFDEASQTVISGIKSSDPKLDTRVGTVLRSLLVNPEAHIEATTTKQLEYARKATSLKSLNESSQAGEQIDEEDVAAVMSNFNITPSKGTIAEGIVKITVTDGEQIYAVSEGTEFTTIDELVFKSKNEIVAKSPENDVAISSNATLYKGAAGYFFLVPVVAEDVGAKYNIAQGTDLQISTPLYTMVSVDAYKTFDGGTDIDNLQDTIDKIPAGLSIRGFVNKDACEGMLRAEFDGGQYPIIDCSTVGYGNGAQRRDKHNLFGIGVGGRIDVYVRNFSDPYTISNIVKGKRRVVSTDEDGNIVQVNYDLTIKADDFPGSCWIKSISSVYDVSSSLDFTCSRTASGTNDTWHDFNIKKNTSETFNTLWQGFSACALEVPPDKEGATGTEIDDWSDDREFVVTVYCLPQASELQEYVDRDNIRSVSTDVVIRCPIICNVEINANVIYDVDNPMDEESVRYKIRSYINNGGFVGTLTRSEIVHILKECGAVSVDLGKKDMLYGRLHDAYGKEYNLSGDSLQIDGLASDDAMLCSSTTIFAAEAENIQLTLTPNK